MTPRSVYGSALWLAGCGSSKAGAHEPDRRPLLPAARRTEPAASPHEPAAEPAPAARRPRTRCSSGSAASPRSPRSSTTSSTAPRPIRGSSSGSSTPTRPTSSGCSSSSCATATGGGVHLHRPRHDQRRTRAWISSTTSSPRWSRTSSARSTSSTSPTARRTSCSARSARSSRRSSSPADKLQADPGRQARQGQAVVRDGQGQGGRELLAAAVTAGKRGQRSFAEQLFSRAELIVGPGRARRRLRRRSARARRRGSRPRSSR